MILTNRSSTRQAMVVLALACLALSPELAMAQQSNPLGAASTFLKMIVQTVIFDWGYYIGIGSLGIIGYRWWTGRMDMMEALKWGGGAMLVFFSPNVVQTLKSMSSGTL